MTQPRPIVPASRIVVVMPNWLGDGVMATPLLRAIRALYPAARIAAVARPLVAPVVEGLGVVAGEDLHVHARGADAAVRRWMQAQKFELGILLPNSFRSAWMLWRAGVTRRVGYARDRRSWLLTDRLAPMPRTSERRAEDRRKSEAIRALGGGKVAVGSDFQPVPAIQYYMQIAHYLSGTALHPMKAPIAGPLMELGITANERVEAAAALAALKIAPGDRWVTLVPGANFGSSKCWPPERFALLADRLIDPAGPFGVKVLLASSPAETPIVNAILNACTQKQGLAALTHLNGGKGVSLGALKEIVRGSALMVCNDTGPRHFAAALGVPIVTLFGPTDPVWADTFVGNERIVRVDVPCGPCQLKKCPIDHRCMRGITVDMVVAAVGEVWTAPATAPRAGTAGVR